MNNLVENMIRKLLKPITDWSFKKEQKEAQLLREEFAENLLKFDDPSNEIGWKIYDYLDEIGMMPDGNILQNEEVDEITYIVKDYISERIANSCKG